MGKKILESSSDEASDNEHAEEVKADNRPPTQEEINSKFGQREVNNEAALLQRLSEIEKNFYNRLESAKLIKKQGRVPFTEHMAIGKLPHSLTPCSL